MKLKKFAALALAGVMAVSMLAGCANKPAEEPTEKPTTSTFTSDLIAALEEKIGDKDYVTVGTDATLQKNLNAVVAAYGLTAQYTNIEKEMKDLDSTLKTDALLDVGTGTKYEDATATATYFSAAVVGADNKTTDYTAVQNFVNYFMNQETGVYGATGTLNDALKFGKSWGAYKSTDVTGKASYTGLEYKYQINVATAKVMNSMTEEGQYVAVYTVTRTATPVAAENANFGK